MARKRGEDVPKRKVGPKKGYRQTPEHVAKRIRTGEAHYAWKGDAVGADTGRQRARKRYQAIGPCSHCGATKTERHHIDGNTLNNEPSNIDVTCRRCHMKHDGRMKAFVEAGERGRRDLWKYAEKAGRARGAQMSARTHCIHGHEFTDENTQVRISRPGRTGTQRICLTCRRATGKRKRERKRDSKVVSKKLSAL